MYFKPNPMKFSMCVFLFFMLISTTQATDYTVTSTLDSGAGSLREAITSANASPGADNIYFNIPISDPNYNSTEGVWEITLGSALPMLTGAFINVDAGTQSTNQGNTNPMGPEIRITHSGTTSYAFLLVSPGNTIKGFIIEDFEYGIVIYNSTATGNTVSNNYVGISYNGMTATPNLYGIGISENAQNNIISGNVISGNTQAGIAITESMGNWIKGNLIGIDPSGMASIPNTYGIAIQEASSNQIGETITQVRNIISGNISAGIVIDGQLSISNSILGNYIGLNQMGFSAVHNESGIILTGASETIIGGNATEKRNVISGNTGSGII